MPAGGRELGEVLVDGEAYFALDDPTGYIENLAKPHAAVVASQARIAQADADREATEREPRPTP